MVLSNVGLPAEMVSKHCPPSRGLTDLLVDRIGPEKGVIHLATAAVVNAVWDMFARARSKPLWKLICDFTPEELVKCVSWR